MAYLVTGGTGYIGSYVVRDLLRQDKGAEVVCFQRSGVTEVAQEVIGEAGLKRVKIVQGDVGDTLQLFDAVKKYNVEVIVNIAFLVPPPSEEQPAYALRVNSVGMNNCLEAMRIFRLKKLVWTSSTNALGRVHELYKKPIGDDDAIYRPNIMYGATKVLNEYMSRHYFDRFGVDTLGFRLPRVYGVGRWHGAAGVFLKFLKEAALNIPTTIEDYDFTTSYLYINDASDMIARACQLPPTKTRVFNLVEGDYSNRQLVETVLKVNPEARVTLRKPEGAAKVYLLPRVNSSGVRAELGWQPKYDLAEGLKEIFNYFRRQAGMPLL